MIAVKVCGLTEPERVRQAVEGGAQFCGLVFYPPSPRSLSPERARELAALVAAGVAKVGVFVDPEDGWLEATIAAARLDIVQLHGFESPERCAAIRARFGVRVMKAIRIAEAGDLTALADYAPVADLILFDAKPPPDPDAIPGGNGLNFDWRLLEGLSLDRPWLLAGGLNADNLEAAVRLTGARMVDVSSGIEIRPGIKDENKLRAFLARARALEAADAAL